MSNSGFLSRWSRLKLEAQRAEAEAAAAKEAAHAAQAQAPASEPVEPAAPAVELPALESLEGLNSDYAAFMQPEVEEDAKRAALKKLFADPHFNQMDGLDIYIDDYTQFEPLPDAMKLALVSAQDFLLDADKERIAAARAEAAAAREELAALNSPQPEPAAPAPSDVAADAPSSAANPDSDSLDKP